MGSYFKYVVLDLIIANTEECLKYGLIRDISRLRTVCGFSFNASMHKKHLLLQMDITPIKQQRGVFRPNNIMHEEGKIFISKRGTELNKY